MSREQLDSEAHRQYTQLRLHSEVREELSERVFQVSFHRSAMEVASLDATRDQQIRYRTEMLSRSNVAARAFYEAHHAELYEMALEEMEADGIRFNFADHREETEYRFGEEIADLEEVSPLNALGAKALQIRNKHIGRADEALAA